MSKTTLYLRVAMKMVFELISLNNQVIVLIQMRCFLCIVYVSREFIMPTWEVGGSWLLNSFSELNQINFAIKVESMYKGIIKVVILSVLVFYQLYFMIFFSLVKNW